MLQHYDLEAPNHVLSSNEEHSAQSTKVLKSSWVISRVIVELKPQH
jgi:hypothetical protein